MRELSVRLKFVTPCLGNAKQPKSGFYFFQRSHGHERKILFLASWHRANMRVASQMLGRYQSAVEQICWDIEIDGVLRANCMTRHFLPKTASGRTRYSVHEAFFPEQEITINCAVPAEIDDSGFWTLLQLAGKYRGLSPFRPRDYGRYEVVSVCARRREPIVE